MQPLGLSLCRKRERLLKCLLCHAVSAISTSGDLSLHAPRGLQEDCGACLVVVELDIVCLGAADAGAIGCHHSICCLPQADALLGSNQGQRIHELLEVDLPRPLCLHLQAVRRPCCSADDAQSQRHRHDPSQSRTHMYCAQKHFTAEDASLRQSEGGQAVLAHPKQLAKSTEKLSESIAEETLMISNERGIPWQRTDQRLKR